MTEPQKVNEKAEFQETPDAARSKQADHADREDPTLSAVKSVMEMHARYSGDAKDAKHAPRVGGHAPTGGQTETRFEPETDTGPRDTGSGTKGGRAALPELDAAGTEPDGTAGPSPVPEAGKRFRLARLTAGFPIRKWIPNRKVTTLLCLAGIVWWRPWLIPGLIFLSIWIALIVYLTVGPDRLAEVIEPLKRRLIARFPDRAEALRTRAQAGSERLARLVEKLPERWRDGIEVPQFGATPQTDAVFEDRPDPFERLAAERDREIGHV